MVSREGVLSGHVVSQTGSDLVLFLRAFPIGGGGSHVVTAATTPIRMTVTTTATAVVVVVVAAPPLLHGRRGEGPRKTTRARSIWHLPVTLEGRGSGLWLLLQ